MYLTKPNMWQDIWLKLMHSQALVHMETDLLVTAAKALHAAATNACTGYKPDAAQHKTAETSVLPYSPAQKE